jgi:hypothetical protein
MPSALMANLQFLPTLTQSQNRHLSIPAKILLEQICKSKNRSSFHESRHKPFGCQYSFWTRAVGVTHAYNMRIKNGISVQPSLSTYNSAYQLL